MMNESRAQFGPEEGYRDEDEEKLKKEIDNLIEIIESNPNDPQNADHYFHLAELYFVSGSFDQAIESISNAIRLNPENWMFYVARAGYYRGKAESLQKNGDYVNAIGQLDRAIADLTTAIQSNPEYYVVSYYYYDRALTRNQKAFLMEKMLEQMRKIDDHQIQDYKKELSEERKKAIDDCTKAIKFNHNDPKFYDLRGNIYEKIGEHKKAKKDFEKRNKLNERKKGK